MIINVGITRCVAQGRTWLPEGIRRHIPWQRSQEGLLNALPRGAIGCPREYSRHIPVATLWGDYSMRCPGVPMAPREYADLSRGCDWHGIAQCVAQGRRSYPREYADLSLLLHLLNWPMRFPMSPCSLGNTHGPFWRVLTAIANKASTIS